MRTQNDVARFLDKTIPEPNSGCLLWTGSANAARAGYGWFRYLGRTHPAHRVAWLLFRGPIPDGLFVCHACDTPPCVNVDHLFLGTPLDNNRDMARKGRRRDGHSSKTHCPKGHEYTPDNTLAMKPAGRGCRACARVAALARYYRKHSGARRGPRGPYKSKHQPITPL